MAVARESSCFGGLKSACHGRCRRLDPFYSDSQVLWQGSAHWTRWWSLARSVFVADAANHFLRTWGRYRMKASLWHLELVYGQCIFVAKRTGRAA